MKNAELKEWIIKQAQDIGIDKIGFTHAGSFEHLRQSIEDQQANKRNSGFEHKNLDERLNPNLIFDNPKTIIAIAVAYPSKITDKPENKGKEKRGKFARASWGVDYHDILKEKMDLLITKLREKTAGQYAFLSMVDTGALIDVAVAARAGIGFIGKNGLLITEEFGSWVFLGEIVTDLEFPPDEEIPNGCGECTRCITACPTGALMGDGRLNAKKCLSYQSQTKNVLPDEFRKKLKTQIYGCDICQTSCPYNKGKDFHLHEEMEPVFEDVQPVLEDLLVMSNKEFKERFSYMAGSWRGKKPLQRNALIALANSNARNSLPLIWQVAKEDVRPEIVATAIWTIGQLTRSWTDELKEEFAHVAKRLDSPIVQEEYDKVLSLDRYSE